MGAGFVDRGGLFHQHRFVLIHVAWAMSSPLGLQAKLWPQNLVRAAAWGFMVDAVNGGHITAVGDGVAVLNGLPAVCWALPSAAGGMPADGGGVLD